MQATHLPALEAVEGLELRGFVGSSPESGRRTADALGLDPTLVFDDVAAMAGDDRIDLVAVCVRVLDHFELVNACLDAGNVSDLVHDGKIGTVLAFRTSTPRSSGVTCGLTLVRRVKSPTRPNAPRREVKCEALHR